MSYDDKLLFDEIERIIRESLGIPLCEVAFRTGVSCRTIEKVVDRLTGKQFRQFRGELVLQEVTRLMSSCPNLALKEISYAVGYDSPRSFARAIRRATGLSPSHLRSSIAVDAQRSELTRERPKLTEEVPTGN